MSDNIVKRITAYLSGGGLFNPELANHDAVRDLLIDARADLSAATAERDRLQILHDEAYIAGMKHGWNCCAEGDEARYKKSIENTREQIRLARAALEGATEKSGAGNE